MEANPRRLAELAAGGFFEVLSIHAQTHNSPPTSAFF
jgi:hypothetical protein